MKIIIRESEKSTPEAPLWVWRIFSGGNREIGFGISPSEEEARERAERAVVANHHRRCPAWLRQKSAEGGSL